MLFTKLSRYIQHKFINTFAIIALGVFFIIFVAQLMTNLKDSIKGSIDFLNLILISFYQVPYFFQKALPFIMLFSALYLIRSLSNTNELDILKATGISIWKFITYIIPVILLIGLIMTLLISPLISTFANKTNMMQNTDTSNTISVNTNNFWISDTTNNTQLIIKSDNATINNGVVLLHSPIVFQIVSQQLKKRISGKLATIINGQIIIENASIKDDKHLLPYFKNQVTLTTKLSAKNLQNIVLSPEMIKIWDLPRFINNLSRLGLNNEQYKVYFYNLIFYPIILLCMFLLGVGLSLSSHKRVANTKIIVYGIGCGFIAYFVTDIINTFGSTGLIPPLITNLSEVLLLISIGLYLIINKEGL
ncbi:LptF/LptG family permease [Rickettsiales bacterium LUAb2]